jgi:uncharacterized protein
MIKDDMQKAVGEAMKGKRLTELKVLRFVLSQIQYAEINKQKALTDDETVALMRKEVKKRKEAIEMFKKGGRQDLIDDEEAQITIIGKFLPAVAPSGDIEKAVDEALAVTAGQPSNPGRIIGMVMGKLKGQADGSEVARIVQEKLNQAKKL